MNKIVIPKTEYIKLQKQAAAYRKLAQKLFESVLRDTVGDTVEDFQRTNLYSENFLRDLEEGLRESSYGKK
ncbi:MAG: hypothetical protein A3G49_05885 [Candidatus Sungbacteria bacterium RIFCSPLOWO2_12_FULL_41_11]|uniref:Uncharacterized protein n=1 Tax=Candidatus Sungbacteria bacterium RIFCSPLOWO2_12_FULL_41_11 TaxID=1802286 RepID=A0A1G2LS50_9BACT|nr:MAG: hypothetical protein A3G49_05885 [Candidatus Sungbacteria bacterium RIFCSPLOWO2_12_FULL_41_11]